METGHQYEHYGTMEIVEMQKHAELKGSSGYTSQKSVSYDNPFLLLGGMHKK